MFILMSIVHEVINIVTLNLIETMYLRIFHVVGQIRFISLHAHAAISCIVAHQKLYYSDLYLLYISHICMFILMSVVYEVINIATSNLRQKYVSKAHSHTKQKMRSL